MTYRAWGLVAGRGGQIPGPLRANEIIDGGWGKLLECERMGG